MQAKEHPEWAGVVHTHLHAHIGAIVAENDLSFLIDQKAQDVAALERGGHTTHGPELLPVHQSLRIVGQIAGTQHCWVTGCHPIGKGA